MNDTFTCERSGSCIHLSLSLSLEFSRCLNFEHWRAQSKTKDLPCFCSPFPLSTPVHHAVHPTHNLTQRTGPQAPQPHTQSPRENRAYNITPRYIPWLVESGQSWAVTKLVFGCLPARRSLPIVAKRRRKRVCQRQDGFGAGVDGLGAGVDGFGAGVRSA